MDQRRSCSEQCGPIRNSNSIWQGFCRTIIDLMTDEIFKFQLFKLKSVDDCDSCDVSIPRHVWFSRTWIASATNSALATVRATT